MKQRVQSLERKWGSCSGVFSPTQNQFHSKVVTPFSSLGVFLKLLWWKKLEQSSESLGRTANTKTDTSLARLTCISGMGWITQTQAYCFSGLCCKSPLLTSANILLYLMILWIRNVGWLRWITVLSHVALAMVVLGDRFHWIPVSFIHGARCCGGHGKLNHGS